MRRAALASLAVAASLAAWLAVGDTFVVGGALQGPIMIQAGPVGWSRACWGPTYERHAIDASWTRCLGVPHGPRRCVGYPPLPAGTDADLDVLPLGPLREIACPASRMRR
ncbi:hypothetical protein [Rubrivirga sp. IMCC45206]|uniref:hypothetical protein n=1 Tax=Rubrivirga sp. IMCC45206 TaxID=3391614 RepID=UPI00398FCD7D